MKELGKYLLYLFLVWLTGFSAVIISELNIFFLKTIEKYLGFWGMITLGFILIGAIGLILLIGIMLLISTSSPW